MKIKHILLTILFLLIMTGCEGTITGIVVDAETGQPIEGAVILVEWTKQKGIPGVLAHTESERVVEVVTDKEGKATINGDYSPFINLTVYKRGYVAWNNKIIFPDYKKRTDFKWENNFVFKLEKFKREYSYDKHTSFIREAIRSHASAEKKQLMKKTYEWEEYKEQWGNEKKSK